MRSATTMALLVVALAACGGDGGPVSAGPVPSVPAVADGRPAPGDERTFELWFIGYDTAACCVVYSTARTGAELGITPALDVGPRLIERVVAALLAGPSPEEEAYGFISSFAEKRGGVPQRQSAVRVLGAKLVDGIATVDLSPEFESFRRGIFQLAQVVYTVTQFPEVEGVRFAIDGRRIRVGAAVSPDGVSWEEGRPLSRPVTRKDYELVVGWVTVVAPTIASEVASPLRVAGSAEADGGVQIVLRDESGTVLARRTAAVSCGDRCRGTYGVEIPFAVSRPQRGSVAISFRHPDCATGRCTVPSIPVRLTKSSIAFVTWPRVVEGGGPWRSKGVLSLVNESLGGQHVLARDLSPRSEATWSPDGRRLAYESGRGGDDEIYVVNADGTGRRRLTRNAVTDIEPSWSPDRGWIAFRRYGGLSSSPRLFVVRPDGTGQRRLTRDGLIDGAAVWSPDGRKLALDRDDFDGNIDVWTMNADGTALRRLTKHPDIDCCAQWSPDGGRILFSARRDGEYDLYLMNADGSGRRRLRSDAGVDLRGPAAWSPGGRHIVFETGHPPRSEIYVMDVNGSQLRRLTRNGVSDQGPVWSPDGRRIAFVRTIEGSVAVVVVNADGTGERILARRKHHAGSLAWAPGG